MSSDQDPGVSPKNWQANQPTIQDVFINLPGFHGDATLPFYKFHLSLRSGVFYFEHISKISKSSLKHECCSKTRVKHQQVTIGWRVLVPWLNERIKGCVLNLLHACISTSLAFDLCIYAGIKCKIHKLRTALQYFTLNSIISILACLRLLVALSIRDGQ